MVSKTPSSWIVAQRDFCTVRRKKCVNKEEWVCVERSTEHALAPIKEEQGIIRGIAHEIASLFKRNKENPSNIDYITVSQIDLKGWISETVCTTVITLLLLQFITMALRAAPEDTLNQIEAAYKAYVSKVGSNVNSPK